MPQIQPYILCGGEGSRLKPLSRPLLPKPFLKLGAKQTLFEQTVNRVRGKNFNPSIAIVNSAHAKLIGEHKHIVEPVACNTAASIAIAALHQKQGIVLILPSDHIIKNNNEFTDILELALKTINRNDVVIFGIEPTEASTQYGYVEKGSEILTDIFAVSKFTEKPDNKAADNYFTSKNFLWNMGIFIFEASVMIKLFEKYQPKLLSVAKKSLSAAKIKDNALYLGEVFKDCENISFDNAIMEKIDNVAIIKTNIEWLDIGSFQSLWQHIEKSLIPTKTAWGQYYAFDDIAILTTIKPSQRITVPKKQNELFFIIVDGTIEITANNSTNQITRNESFLLRRNCEFILINKSLKPATMFQIEKL